jgi:hypothetical protein
MSLTLGRPLPSWVADADAGLAAVRAAIRRTR